MSLAPFVQKQVKSSVVSAARRLEATKNEFQ